MGERVLNIIGTLATGAIVVAVVTNPRFPSVIRSFGRAFEGAVRSATQQG